jgi:small subunit ribosomal protein S6
VICSFIQIESIRGITLCQGGLPFCVTGIRVVLVTYGGIGEVLFMLAVLWYNGIKFVMDKEMVARKKEALKVADKRLQDYELVYIVSPEVTDESLETKIDGISQFITGKEGIVSDVERWGKKKLAYPVGHSLEGNYVLTRFKMPPTRSKELEANLSISEEILRHLLIKVSG